MNSSSHKITVIGLGQSGCTWVRRMVGITLPGVNLISVDSDPHTLNWSLAPVKLLLQGLDKGYGLNEVSTAARTSIEKIREIIKGSDMTICATGLGGLTGTGSISVIAQTAKEMDALSVAVVTLPFTFEANSRKEYAHTCLTDLKLIANRVMVIPNDLVIKGHEKKLTLQMAFQQVDDTVIRVLAFICMITVR